MDFLDDAAEPFPTVEDQAAAVLMLADAAGIERFALVGASYGGSVGLSLAAMAANQAAENHWPMQIEEHAVTKCFCSTLITSDLLVTYDFS